MKRFKKVKIASILGIIINLFLFVIKAIIGFITNSQAMIADAFNSGGDILTSLITFIGNKIASKPRDDDHDLGHGKAEYIYAMLISVIMILTSLLILKDSVVSMFSHTIYNFSFWLIIVCIITIILKLFLYLYTRKIAKEEHNLLIKANSCDHRNDCILTTLSLISCILSFYNIYFVDGIVGSIISLWIIISSIQIFIESYDVLMDKSMSIETRNKVYEIINRHEEIKRINHFNATPVGYKYQISFTIFVDGDMSTFDSHEIADKLEKEINKNVEEIYLTVIHVNPIEIKVDK